MAAPALRLLYPTELAPLASRLLRQQFRRSAPIDLGVYRSTGLITRYRGYNPLDARGLYSGRHVWNRVRIPQYGSLTRNIPVTEIIVPAGTQFLYRNEHDLPTHLPVFKMAPTRAVGLYERAGLPVPDLELQIAEPPPRGRGLGRGGNGPPPEAFRRRHDSKVPYGYRRLLAMLNRTYGPISEYLEISRAIDSARNPLELSTLLALNQAVDIAYGRRSQWLKKNVYNSQEWTLPVGYDTLSRLWR